MVKIKTLLDSVAWTLGPKPGWQYNLLQNLAFQISKHLRKNDSVGRQGMGQSEAAAAVHVGLWETSVGPHMLAAGQQQGIVRGAHPTLQKNIYHFLESLLLLAFARGWGSIRLKMLGVCDLV